MKLDDATTQDALVDGAASEFKQPRAFQVRTLEQQLKSARHQSPTVYVRLTQPLPEWERAKQKAERWLRSHLGRRLLIIHEYETPIRIEEITP